jgi:hypothetical protein
MGGVRRMKGPKPGSLRALKKRITKLGVQASTTIAQRAAPELTSRAQADYDGGRTVYGEPRPRGEYGPLTLVRTGATRRYLRFAAAGSIMRVALGTPYAKYLVGKYKILPIGDRTAMPVAWARAIDGIVVSVLDEQWSRSKAA